METKSRTSPRTKLSDGSWQGGSAILIGGGPSLRGFDWSRFANRPHVIAINRAVIDCPTAEVFFTEDERVVKKYAAELSAFQGEKFIQCEEVYVEGCLAAVPDLHVLRRTRKDKFWAHSLAEGLSYSSNSAIGAANLAEILGAETLYLFGIDCRSESRLITNYHDDYKERDGWAVNSDQLASFKSDWEHWVKPHAAMKIWNVINPAFPSALKCFPSITYNDWLTKTGVACSPSR